MLVGIWNEMAAEEPSRTKVRKNIYKLVKIIIIVPFYEICKITDYRFPFKWTWDTLSRSVLQGNKHRSIETQIIQNFETKSLVFATVNVCGSNTCSLGLKEKIMLKLFSRSRGHSKVYFGTLRFDICIYSYYCNMVYYILVYIPNITCTCSLPNLFIFAVWGVGLR